MHSPFTTENQKHQRSKNCPKWEPCEELNLLWKHCQRLEVPMPSLSCVTDTGRSLCSNEQLRSDVHSCPRALIHWGMIIQPKSVIYDFMIKCFISQPAHGTRGDSHDPGSAEGPHTHISNATTASLPIQELVLPGQSSHDVGAVVLVTLLKGNISLTGKRVTFVSIREMQVVFVQQLLQLEDSSFLSLFCPLAMWKWMGNPHTASALVLFSPACYFNVLSLSAAVHHEHRVQQGIKHGGHFPPGITKAAPWKGSNTAENGRNRSLSSGLRRDNSLFPLCTALCRVILALYV